MFLLIGQYHPDLTDYFERHGLAFHLLLDRKRYDSPGAVDFSDWTDVVAAAEKLPQRPTVVFALYEQYIPAAAKLAKALGIDTGLSERAALAVTDKLAMRRAFDTAPTPISTPYEEVGSLDDAESFVVSHGFPVYLKPTNLSKSLLVQRCDTPEELHLAVARAFEASPALYRRYAADRTPHFIIEKALEGSIHTVAGFVNKDGDVTFAPGIVDNESAIDVGFDDSFIYRRMMPSTLDESSSRSLFECARMAAQSLGLRSCPIHAELILTDDGARIIEIGARLGGYRARMYDAAYGIDLIEAALTSYAGKTVSFRFEDSNLVAVYEFFPRTPGALRSVGDIASIKRLDSFSHLGLFKEIGSSVGRARDGFKAVGSITLSHESKKTLLSDQRKLESLIDITTD